MKQDKKDKKKATQQGGATADVAIRERWDLPDVLKEISGLAYIDAERFACVQDEDGIVFIYNTREKRIEKEIPFAGPGDYEGITVKNNTAYVVRADGVLYEVNLRGEGETAKTYKTPLTIEHNVEGLCYDVGNDRLLMAIKNNEPGNLAYKGVYAFDLSRNSFIEKPVYKIDLESEAMSTSSGKKNRGVMPSAIAINPVTKELFITDGPKSNLMMLDNSGNVKRVWQLGKEFAQPEGLTFSPKGDIYISNEGTKRPGNILQVKID